MSRLLVVLLLAARGGAAWLPAQTPDSTRTFSSTHIDSTRVYFTRVVSQPPRIDTLIDTLWCTGGDCSASRPALGVPFGPFAFWSSNTTVAWGPAPFTASIGQNSPGGIVARITAARAYGLHLVLCLAGCAHAPVTTNGAFDLAKWQAAVARYNTPAIRDAIAQAVADGTVIGNSLLDEPHHSSWGGVITKAMLDEMATYARSYFPTLPMGVNFGQTAGYTWRSDERFHALDFAIHQYAWAATKGDVATYRTKVLAQAVADGYVPAFSLNIVNGGVQDRDSVYDCGGAAKGQRSPWCAMTATQIRDWGKALGPAGCALLMWRYDSLAMGRPDNQQAMRDVAAVLAKVPQRGCTRHSEQPVLSRGSSMPRW
jgi:hypothetical protein